MVAYMPGATEVVPRVSYGWLARSFLYPQAKSVLSIVALMLRRDFFPRHLSRRLKVRMYNRLFFLFLFLALCPQVQDEYERIKTRRVNEAVMFKQISKLRDASKRYVCVCVCVFFMS